MQFHLLRHGQNACFQSRSHPGHQWAIIVGQLFASNKTQIAGLLEMWAERDRLLEMG